MIGGYCVDNRENDIINVLMLIKSGSSFDCFSDGDNLYLTSKYKIIHGISNPILSINGKLYHLRKSEFIRIKDALIERQTKEPNDNIKRFLEKIPVTNIDNNRKIGRIFGNKSTGIELVPSTIIDVDTIFLMNKVKHRIIGTDGDKNEVELVDNTDVKFKIDKSIVKKYKIINHQTQKSIFNCFDKNRI